MTYNLQVILVSIKGAIALSMILVIIHLRYLRENSNKRLKIFYCAYPFLVILFITHLTNPTIGSLVFPV